MAAKSSVNDLLGPSKKTTKKPKVDIDDLLGNPAKTYKASGGLRSYIPLDRPKNPSPDGIFALKDAKGQNLGRTCLFCKVELKHKGGRRPIICKKAECYRQYRNAYRRDYDASRSAA
jgi:hypothetical protein